MKTIIINLARATERRARLEKQIATLGLDAEFLTATDGRQLTAADRALVNHTGRKLITPYPLTDNEIGCWQSHRRAMMRMLELNVPMAAILEDDATLGPDYARVLQAIESELDPAQFDIIDLHRKFKKTEIFVPCRALLPGYAVGRIGYTHMEAPGYVMTRRGAERFLRRLKYFDHAVDKAMHRYWANGLELYGLEQPIVEPDDAGHSFIDETRGQNRPSDRPRYPDADALPWVIGRRLTRAYDSLMKRLVFPLYAWRGKALLTASK